VPVRDVVLYPDERLRSPSAAVTDFDEDLSRLVEDLVDTMVAHGALGLSAPQVGDGRAALVFRPSVDAEPAVFVNPQIVGRSTFGFVEESCLSVPGIVGSVVRATRVRVRARDVSGAPIERSLEGMAAVCLQHEADHLEGRLFFDRFSPLGRMRARARLRRALAASPAREAAPPA